MFQGGGPGLPLTLISAPELLIYVQMSRTLLVLTYSTPSTRSCGKVRLQSPIERKKRVVGRIWESYQKKTGFTAGANVNYNDHRNSVHYRFLATIQSYKVDILHLFLVIFDSMECFKC